MDFSLTDHQKLIRDTVRQFMDTEVRPLVNQLERDENFDILKIGEMGWLRHAHLEEGGGDGQSFRTS
jgi:alkylation response protein AidB-like acyl-CoA dehydrogenase